MNKFLYSILILFVLVLAIALGHSIWEARDQRYDSRAMHTPTVSAPRSNQQRINIQDQLRQVVIEQADSQKRAIEYDMILLQTFLGLASFIIVFLGLFGYTSIRQLNVYAKQEADRTSADLHDKMDALDKMIKMRQEHAQQLFEMKSAAFSEKLDYEFKEMRNQITHVQERYLDQTYLKINADIKDIYEARINDLEERSARLESHILQLLERSNQAGSASKSQPDPASAPEGSPANTEPKSSMRPRSVEEGDM